jgi:hypothetical protein
MIQEREESLADSCCSCRLRPSDGIGHGLFRVRGQLLRREVKKTYVIGRVGCWVVANRTSVGFGSSWNGRSDMAVLVAEHLLKLPQDSVGKAFVELVVRQHNSTIPRKDRDAFIGLCQRMSGELLGLGAVLDDVDEPEGEG